MKLRYHADLATAESGQNPWFSAAMHVSPAHHQKSINFNFDFGGMLAAK